MRKTRHGTNTASSNFLGKLILFAVIDAYLIDLLLTCLGAGTSVNHLFGMQRAAGHLNPSQALTAIPAADAVDARGKPEAIPAHASVRICRPAARPRLGP